MREITEQEKINIIKSVIKEKRLKFEKSEIQVGNKKYSTKSCIHSVILHSLGNVIIEFTQTEKKAFLRYGEKKEQVLLLN